MTQTWFHGSEEEIHGDFDLSRFGSGAFTRLSLGVTGKIPAVYLTTSRAHAAEYGDVVHGFTLDTTGAVCVDAKSELEAWAAENGYQSAQQMVDDYYAGDAYNALCADQRFDEAAREAAANGVSVAIVDFGDLKNTADRAVRLGQVAIVLKPSMISTQREN